MDYRTSQSGFTLSELLITLTIGGILLSVAVPSYSLFVRNSRQVSSANELLGSFRLARDLAISRNARITVCPSSDGTDCDAVNWDQGWIVFADTDGDRSVDATETIDRAVTDVGTPSMTSAEFGNFIIYRPNGRVMVNTVAENSGEMTLCDQRGSDYARVIIVDLSGRPRVSKYTAGGGAPVCPDLG